MSRPGYILDHNGRPAGQPSSIALPGQPIVPGAAPVPPLDQLVPALRARGVPIVMHTGWDEVGNVVLVAQCGPVSIPCEFNLDVAQAQILPALLKAIGEARLKLAPPAPPDCEDLLAEAMANVLPIPAEAVADSPVEPEGLAG
jgi:hypothetical protein